MRLSSWTSLRRDDKEQFLLKQYKIHLFQRKRSSSKKIRELQPMTMNTYGDEIKCCRNIKNKRVWHLFIFHSINSKYRPSHHLVEALSVLTSALRHFAGRLQYRTFTDALGVSRCLKQNVHRPLSSIVFSFASKLRSRKVLHNAAACSSVSTKEQRKRHLLSLAITSTAANVS
jgi:hypothetical protein